jgi:hypothetical protein
MMPDLLLGSFTTLLCTFQPCFTQPSFNSFWAVACAWILSSGYMNRRRPIDVTPLESWRPRRDLNPCYRRESEVPCGNLLKLRDTDGLPKPRKGSLWTNKWTIIGPKF